MTDLLRSSLRKSAPARGFTARLGEIDAIDGSKTTRGAALVNLVLCGCAAYRMQLFLYLKACGREELNTMNLWAGGDAAAAV